MELQPSESYYTESTTESNFPITNIPSQTEKLPGKPNMEIGGFNEPIVLAESVKEQSSIQPKNLQRPSKTSINPSSHIPNTPVVILEETPQIETQVTNLSTYQMKSDQQASLVRLRIRIVIHIKTWNPKKILLTYTIFVP